ncbi:hypothetical protein BDY17DRAFT_37430 [Neohortaea acidophila]|uniref:Uncharacterized protein n=1 Tax=Neohortaea acidophila TaxID=245834 RepID=A0A6A6PHD8_9PEZI|nr:uncharacterized protein BDY17DRAFT_37430 [Neohortaea acidophila]KAF2479382.1 hypothetical protein BDY17DRAFT_37430 [Neohortaea acidophila]
MLNPHSGELLGKFILYGIDKIPDKWFDRVPGGYYRAKDGKIIAKKDAPGEAKQQKRRGQTDYISSRPLREEDAHDDGYRSDRGRHRYRRRSSHNGGDDEDDCDDEDDYYHRRDDRHARSKSQRARRGEEDDRYGYDDGYRYPPRRSEYEDRNERRPERERERPRRRPDYEHRRKSHPGILSSQIPLEPPPIGIPLHRHTGMAPTYVPYAHIYNQAGQQFPQQHFTPDLSFMSRRHPSDPKYAAPFPNPFEQHRSSAQSASPTAGTAHRDPKPTLHPPSHQSSRSSTHRRPSSTTALADGDPGTPSGTNNLSGPPGRHIHHSPRPSAQATSSTLGVTDGVPAGTILRPESARLGGRSDAQSRSLRNEGGRLASGGSYRDSGKHQAAEYGDITGLGEASSRGRQGKRERERYYADRNGA